MGYRNDQWYGLNNESSGENIGTRTRTASGYNTPADNPIFRWPNRAIRTDDHEGYQTKYLKRGYIRSIPFSQGDTDYVMKKCQFQFNPRVINQSVSMNTAAYNFLLQNPEDFNQPMPTSVNFGFELMFDRSMEMNNPTFGSESRINEVNPWENSDPAQVGVLADLQAFFNVIGQGLSASQLEYVTRVFEERAQQLPDGVRYRGGTGNPTTALPVGEGGGIDLNVNIGNSAFLLPMPVRVVFSSLYVVEGFVQNTAVSFTKFNTDMVPMQCFLTVSMEAKYIGFAKKDTYLTYTLEQAADAAEQTLQEETNRVSGYQQALENAAGVVEMKLVPTGLRSRVNTWPTSNSDMESAVQDDDYEYELFWRLPTINKDVTDDVAKLMDDGSNISINVYPTLSLYKTDNGWRPTGQIPSGSAQAVFKNQIAQSTQVLSLGPDGGWEEAVAESDKWYKFSRSSHTRPKKNTNTVTVNENDTFIARYQVNITCIVDGVVISGFADQYYLLNDLTNDGLFKRVNVIWPQAQSLGDDSGSNEGTVPASNAATDPPRAGSTSNVGGSNGNRTIFNRTRVT